MVKALGGIFLYSENPKVLAEWYEDKLGLKYEYTEQYKAYYISFPYLEMDRDTQRYTIFSILHNKHKPVVDGKFFTINLRVGNMESTVEHLKALNIDVRGPETHDEGKFAWINDPEGNYIELWEDVT
jgi:catechol-2,3-dioxygenase